MLLTTLEVSYQIGGDVNTWRVMSGTYVEPPMITSDQIRAARSLLRWEQVRLAEASGVSVETIKRIEKATDALSNIRAGTIDAIERAFAKAGVSFVPENGGGAGVRFREPRR